MSDSKKIDSDLKSAVIRALRIGRPVESDGLVLDLDFICRAICQDVSEVPGIFRAEFDYFDGFDEERYASGGQIIEGSGDFSDQMLTIPINNEAKVNLRLFYLRESKDLIDVLSLVISNRIKVVFENIFKVAQVIGMFEDFSKAVVMALNEKSEHTAKHCKSVPIIAKSIAQLVNDHPDMFNNEMFDSSRLHQLEIAAWLHDIGKVSVSDAVLEKSKRLEFFGNTEDSILDRLSLYEIQKGEKPKWFDILRAAIKRSNKGENLTESEILAVKKCQQMNYMSEHGKKPLLKPYEAEALSLQRGTLTKNEREIMESHAIKGVRILDEIKFPDFLSEVKEYAVNHHERMDGAGYPHGLTGDQLSLGARIMCVADVYEALISKRPYKKPIPRERVKTILLDMAQSGHLDELIVSIFINSDFFWQYGED